jgi:hypothetical protein
VKQVFVVIIGVTVFVAPLSAQGGRVRGRVIEADGGGPVADVALVADGRAGVLALTNSAGMYSLTLPAGVTRLVASRLGFMPETLAVAGLELDFQLRAAALAIDPVHVEADRAMTAATSRVTHELDIRLRPRESSQELLRLAPGLVIAQHAGGGKAEQIFLRGFDADHGTDVAVSVDGVPVNMVSHAHGQGYADLHFLMPEVVSRVNVRKGLYDAADGDLATAGAVSLETLDRLGRFTISSRGGSFESGHLFAGVPFGGDATHAGGYVALSGHLTRGPFEAPQDYRRYNAFAKWTTPLGGGAEAFATASAFGASWDASGQVPRRAIEAGTIGRFGAIDPLEGGSTSRIEARAGVRGFGDQSAWDLRAYAVDYDFRLFSNFTFFLNDAVNGDGIEQVDDRRLFGASGSYARMFDVLGRPARTSVGAGTRSDRAAVALHSQESRTRLGTRVDADITQDHLFAWAKQEVPLSQRLRLELGVRADAFRFDVQDHSPTSDDLQRASGDAWRGLVSPKINVALQATPSLALFANAGLGFHSNDARDVILADSMRVLPRATGAELGARRTWHAGSISAAIWALDLQSELVYVGDEGVTEASGRTRRTGIDADARVRLTRWLWADADVNLARGRFRDEPDGADLVPLAPTVTSSGGLTVRDAGPLSGGARFRHVGDRAADETNTIRAEGHTLFDVFATWNLGRAEITAAIDNLFDARWNEAQFATTSRLRNETEPVTELHFTPGSPRSFQLGLRYRF